MNKIELIKKSITTEEIQELLHEIVFWLESNIGLMDLQDRLSFFNDTLLWDQIEFGGESRWKNSNEGWILNFSYVFKDSSINRITDYFHIYIKDDSLALLFKLRFG